ncbi:serine/threonine-protein kinase [Mycobacterium simiae]|uniref:serine/threonine-protein kinase n=1 Tax=Mycobacterium simiae TaxID=1784 RepID=UPI00165F8724|nr:serine/threonine-protein kinase [Mycobacterium simiae]
MPLRIGEVFAGYTILRVLGSGAMGAVYLAQHPRLPRRDALKVLSPALTGEPEYRARFARESDIAASLSHPNILGIHDCGESDGQFWISMDFVDGIDAAQLLHERYPSGMPVSVAMQIITPVASALDYAHQRGLLHRDVKPSNILIADPGAETQRVYLADFGIARSLDDTAGLTATNVAMGTVAYAAPEQLMGEPLDGRADQYALACSAFHLLAGARPYDYPSAAVVITKHVMAPPASIGQYRPELTHLEPVFARAMAKKPAERFARCQDFTAQLQRGSDWGAGAQAPRPAPTPTYEHDPQETQVAHSRYAPVRPQAPQPPPQPLPSQLPPQPSPSQLPPPIGTRQGRRPHVMVAALVATAVLIGGGIFAGVKLTRHQSPATAAPPTGAAATTAGPFTGTYRGDYGPALGIDGGPVEGPKPSTTTWGVRSVCRPTGCVATASRVGGETTMLSTMVFDDVGGRWLAVGTGTDTCLDVPGEFWVVMTLQQRPDGTLAGEIAKTSANGCGVKNPVTFTRIGDVDVNSVSDPASQPPRVVSPAEALRGRYHDTVNWAEEPKQEYDWVVSTDCLRTGDRCMSYFHAPPDGSKPLVFGGRTWVLSTEEHVKCRNGGTSHVANTAEFAPPQPPQDPIVRLTGHGHHQQSGSCSHITEFEETFERTGD